GQLRRSSPNNSQQPEHLRRSNVPQSQPRRANKLIARQEMQLTINLKRLAVSHGGPRLEKPHAALHFLHEFDELDLTGLAGFQILNHGNVTELFQTNDLPCACKKIKPVQRRHRIKLDVIACLRAPADADLYDRFDIKMLF